MCVHACRGEYACMACACSSCCERLACWKTGVPQPSTVNSGRYGTYGCCSGTTCSPWRGTCAECGRNEASPCVEALLKAWMGSEFGSGGDHAGASGSRPGMLPCWGPVGVSDAVTASRGSSEAAPRRCEAEESVSGRGTKVSAIVIEPHSSRSRVPTGPRDSHRPK